MVYSSVTFLFFLSGRLPGSYSSCRSGCATHGCCCHRSCSTPGVVGPSWCCWSSQPWSSMRWLRFVASGRRSELAGGMPRAMLRGSVGRTLNIATTGQVPTGFLKFRGPRKHGMGPSANYRCGLPPGPLLRVRSTPGHGVGIWSAGLRAAVREKINQTAHNGAKLHDRRGPVWVSAPHYDQH
jgi:hypothetical protein